MSDSILDVCGPMPEDNEATQSPWWMIVDPPTIYHLEDFEPCDHGEDADEDDGCYCTEDVYSGEKGMPCHKSALSQASMNIDGPFFSREEATEYLKAKRYNYGPRAAVWCASGSASRRWGALCAARRLA